MTNPDRQPACHTGAPVSTEPDDPERAPSGEAGLPDIHETAVVDEDAALEAGVEIGPFATVGPGVRIGRGSSVGAHAVIEGPTDIGERCQIHPHAVIGSPPQHLGHEGESTRLVIGAECVIREFATINRGTREGGGVTRIGQGCLLMAYTHVAHDCHLGDGVVLANGATLAGHVVVGDGAVLSGLCGVQQFTRIGRLAFIAGGAMVDRDVPPFVRVAGDRAGLVGLNVVGLRRSGAQADVLQALKSAYRAMFRSDALVAEAAADIREKLGAIDEVRELLDFIDTSERGICR